VFTPFGEYNPPSQSTLPHSGYCAAPGPNTIDMRAPESAQMWISDEIEYLLLVGTTIVTPPMYTSDREGTPLIVILYPSALPKGITQSATAALDQQYYYGIDQSGETAAAGLCQHTSTDKSLLAAEIKTWDTDFLTEIGAPFVDYTTCCRMMGDAYTPQVGCS
jgi:hypothetical protein